MHLTMSIAHPYVVEGTGTGLVIKTGDETVMGCIAGLVATLDSGKTPINKEVDYKIC